MKKEIERTNPEKRISLSELCKPLPSFEYARSKKVEYRDILIDKSHPLHSDELTSLWTYRIAGQAYYSRHNEATIEPVDGVAAEVYIRNDIAQRLQLLNKILDQPEIEQLFGGKIELYVEEGVRDIKTQSYLYEVVFPGLIQAQNPQFTETQVFARRDELIAQPSVDSSRPSPHSTGGAVDMTLRHRQPHNSYAPGSHLVFAREDASTDLSCNPDFCEDIANKPTDMPIEEWETIRATRRILINGALSVGLFVNPTEYWHFGRGDQLSSFVAKTVYQQDLPAYYGPVTQN
jgi:D-alanyl-D-alanine dipeptidase